MSIISLIRHGQTDWNALGKIQGSSDVPLNQTGRDQAKRTGQALSFRTYKKIFCSPLSRARETAKIISSYLGGESPIVLDAVRERHYGEAESLTNVELYQKWPDDVVPGRELREEVFTRSLDALYSIAQPSDNDDYFLVVTHGGVIGALARVLSHYYLPRHKEIMENCSTHDFEFHNKTLSLKHFNLTPEHLDQMAQIERYAQ